MDASGQAYASVALPRVLIEYEVGEPKIRSRRFGEEVALYRLPGFERRIVRSVP